MKVYLRDKRVNPRVIYIDGKRYVLPSNKEVVKEISRAAFNNLSAMNCISIREYTEPEEEGNLVEAPAEEQPKKEETKPVNTQKKPEPEVDVSGLVVEDKLEDSSIVSSVEEPKHEEAPKVEEPVEENKEEAPVEEAKSEDTPVQEEANPEGEEKPNYSSLTKKELKALVEEKGGDTSGMTKANLIDWLNANA